MKKKDPYNIIKHRHSTEKSVTLEGLKNNKSNRCVARCQKPKYVFIVDTEANKQEIAQAVEEIYRERNIRVLSVNTINVKGKQRFLRGRKGVRKDFKKAVVTLETGDSLDNT